MLSRLTIKNVALIEKAEIEFGEGLNVLSGETGAGKSVILDSVNFVLGAKADRAMIRHGETECAVRAEFFVPENSKSVSAMRELDIDSDGEIIITRKFSENGKNSIKINGNTVTATMLRKVTDSLVDVHGQSEHFYLLKESNQLKTLDQIVGRELEEEKVKLANYLKEKREIDENIALIGGDEKERGRRLDILQFQIDEIKSVDLKDGEEDELLAKRNKINNLEKIISAIRDSLNALSGEQAAIDCLRSAGRALTGISRLDKDYEDIFNKIEDLTAEAEDVAEILSDVSDDLYFDEAEAEEIESRLDDIRQLKRKYGGDKAEIDAYYEKICAEFELLSDSEGQYVKLLDRRNKINSAIFKVCQQMTQLRKTHGRAFCKRVTEELKTLNIAHAQFDIEFSPYLESDVEKVNMNGLDSISFLFSANAGEPLKPLSKIISGGEMSRFMLAMKTQFSEVNEISTYIFDEIDAGISGKTAKVVGEKLAKIAKNTQILAVSHLAQIAVMSDQEYLIEKRENEEKTVTLVQKLDVKEKQKEIVRLLGGTDDDEFAVKHAIELQKQAVEFKKSI